MRLRLCQKVASTTDEKGKYFKVASSDMMCIAQGSLAIESGD